jgi:hypothetical protein
VLVIKMLTLSKHAIYCCWIHCARHICITERYIWADDCAELILGSVVIFVPSRRGAFMPLIDLSNKQGGSRDRNNEAQFDI